MSVIDNILVEFEERGLVKVKRFIHPEIQYNEALAEYPLSFTRDASGKLVGRVVPF